MLPYTRDVHELNQSHFLWTSEMLAMDMGTEDENEQSLLQFMLKRELLEKEMLPVVMLRNSSETTAAKEEQTHGEM